MPCLRIALVALVTLLVSLASTDLAAQSDSTEFKTEDIIYIKDSGPSQRTIYRGKIISLDNETGTVVFVDHQGAKYVFKPEQIEKILEDQIVEVRKGWFSKPQTLHPRQNTGFDIQVGFFTASTAVERSFTPDEYWLESWQTFGDMPSGGRLGLGLQVDSVHYIGAVLDLAFITWNATYLSGGMRYVNRFPSKRNAAFYVPVELRFSTSAGELEFKVAEQDPDITWLEERYRFFDFTQTGLELSLGTGVQWALANQRAISLEAGIFRQFNMNVEFDGIPAGQTQPDVDYTLNGGRLALMYHL